MSFDFALPLNREDLLHKRGVNHYVVQEVYPLRILPAKLKELRLTLRSQGPIALLHHFDALFSVISQWQSVSPEMKEDGWDLTIKVVTSLSSKLVEVLENRDNCESSDRHLQLNLVKMAAYLLCQYIELLENDVCKPLVTTTKGRGRKKTTHAAVADMDMDWEREREKSVRTLLQLVQLNLHSLWEPPIAEEEFVNLVTCCCYKLLENKDVTKDKNTRDLVFRLLGVMVKRYNHMLGCSLKFLQLLQHFEHLTSHLAHAVQMFVTEFGMKTMPAQIMREVGQMDPKDLARDSSGGRAYSSFLVELSERTPAEMLPSISVLLPLLDEEPYYMRIGVLGVLGEMCIRLLSGDDIDKKHKTTRDQFLDKLEDHIHDTNAFARSKTLQIWLSIINSKSQILPMPRQQQLLELVIGRLQDKSNLVRKFAIQLTTAMLQSNPFAAKLPADELRENYEKEKEKLQQMEPPAPTVSPQDALVTELAREWERIAGLIQAQQTKDEQDDDSSSDNSTELITDDDTAPLVKAKLVSQLKEGRCKEALRLLSAAREVFGADPVFCEEQPPEDEAMDEEEARTQRHQAVRTTLRTIFYGELLQRDVLEGALGSLPPPTSTEADLLTDYNKQQVLVHYLKDSMNFVVEIQKAVPIIAQLLGSKNTSDVLEAINFFVAGFRFGVSNAMVGIRRMLLLVWSKEKSVKEAVVEAYRDLYLTADSTANPRVRALAVVNNLSALTDGATVGDLTSLEELVCEFVRTKDLDSHVIQLLFERFAMKIPGTTASQSSAALCLLSMAAGAEVEIVQSNVEVLVKEGLGERGQADCVLVKDTCVALTKLAPSQKAKPGLTTEPLRFPQDHDMFTRLAQILTTTVDQLALSDWVPMAEQAINVIYKLSEHPDIIAGQVIKKIASIIIKQSQGTVDGDQSNVSMEGQEPEPSSSQEREACGGEVLTRFLSLAGHVALRQLVHLDVATYGELRRRAAIKEDQGDKAKIGGDTTASSTVRAHEGGGENEDEEMGLAGASADDTEAEYIYKITETDIVTGSNLLGVLRPLLLFVCRNQTRYDDVELQAAASLALAKFMLVSSQFCEEHLQLLFTILEKSPHPIIRANTIIALGDMAFRFPNLIEPWTPNLYTRLRDDSCLVRKNSLMVLTHLILNDMVKVKGQISELAACIVDPVDQISGLAKLFFNELSHKGNAIYNIMPDLVSRLSDTEVGVAEDSFRTIMRLLFSFIQKDRQCESLVEKLCHRFRATMVQRQWRDIAFCLALLPFNDKALRKLQENLPSYADKMADKDIYNSFTTILSGAKKFAKPEIKALVEELETRFDQCHNKGVEDEEIAQQACVASARNRTPSRSPGKRGRGSRVKTPGTSRPRRKHTSKDSPSKSDFLCTPANRPKAASKVRPTFDSDDDSDMELFQVDEKTAEKIEKSDAENNDPNISFESPGLKLLKKRHPSVNNRANKHMTTRTRIKVV